MTSPNQCSGIIVFNNSKTILVSTKVGNLSFPKGKKENMETDIETAWRELKEETGLTNEHIQLINEETIEEYTNKGNICIRYYIGFLIVEPPTFKFNENELSNVAWYEIKDALELTKLKKTRKEILTKAYTRYQEFNV
jgi:8-oxo-dGTP pyrophosphatase MutT (NUDIX family)